MSNVNRPPEVIALTERAEAERGQQLGETRQGHEELPHQPGALRRPGEHPGSGQGGKAAAAGKWSIRTLTRTFPGDFPEQIQLSHLMFLGRDGRGGVR